MKKKGSGIVLLRAGLSVVTERIRREIGVNYYIINELQCRSRTVEGHADVVVRSNNLSDISPLPCKQNLS